MLILTIPLAGCQSGAQSVPGKRTRPASDCCKDLQELRKRKALSIVDGQVFYEDQMLQSLLEASGAEILLEHVLEKLIHRAYQKGVSEGQWQDIRPEIELAKEREAEIFRRNMSDDPVLATRLVKRMQLERGLGSGRYDNLLKRNALLRQMVKGRVKISEEMIKQTFQMVYGEKYVLQIIVATDLPKAKQLLLELQKADQNAAVFSRLARKNSTDESARNGGFLPPFNAADDQWPLEIRRMAGRLAVGEISAPLVLPGRGGQGTQIGILRLDERIPARKIQFSDAKARLKVKLRDRLESVEMQQLSKRLLAESDISVMNREVKKAWDVITGLKELSSE